MLTDMQRQFADVAQATMREDGPVYYGVGTRTALAHYLLGRLEGENGTTIKEIVKAARAASCDTCDGDGFVTYGDEEEDNCPRGHRSFDEDALFRAITLEFLTGEGRVRQEFGEIGIEGEREVQHRRVAERELDDVIRDHSTTVIAAMARELKSYRSSTRPLIIPRLAVEGATA